MAETVPHKKVVQVSDYWCAKFEMHFLTGAKSTYETRLQNGTCTACIPFGRTAPAHAANYSRTVQDKSVTWLPIRRQIGTKTKPNKKQYQWPQPPQSCSHSAPAHCYTFRCRHHSLFRLAVPAVPAGCRSRRSGYVIKFAYLPCKHAVIFVRSQLLKVPHNPPNRFWSGDKKSAPCGASETARADN